jgi:hypothetical protein
MERNYYFISLEKLICEYSNPKASKIWYHYFQFIVSLFWFGLFFSIRSKIYFLSFSKILIFLFILFLNIPVNKII